MKPLWLTVFLLAACAQGQADRPTLESAAMTSESPAPGEVLATREAPVVLDKERTTVEIEMPPATAESLEEGKLGIYLEGLDLGRTGAYFDVYANSQPVGTLSSFGPAGAKVAFDITGLVRKLEEKGDWKGDLKLTFVRRGLEAPEGAPGAEVMPEEGPPPRFQRIRIVRERP